MIIQPAALEALQAAWAEADARAEAATQRVDHATDQAAHQAKRLWHAQRHWAAVWAQEEGGVPTAGAPCWIMPMVQAIAR